MKIVAPKDLYLEGYSYWLYTKPFIVEHLKKFPDDTLKSIVRSIDENFVKTCYTVEGIRYPAPFGDLRHGPLEEDLQFSKIVVPETIDIFPVSRSKNKFNIKPAPIGFNLHVPINEKVYSIIDGKVIDTEAKEEFKWYTGYKDKYPTKWSEIRDMCRIKRILSLFRI